MSFNKIVQLNISKILKTIKFSRNYALKSDLKIKWVRPEKIPCIKPEKSGDLKPLPEIDRKQIAPEFQHCKELEDADEVVRNLFTLEYLPRWKTKLATQYEIVNSVKRHPQDNGSMEVKLAKMTVSIRNMQKVIEEFPHNRAVRVHLKELIDRRKKYLKFMRRWDYKRFEWLLEKLDLVYKPPPNEFHWITRKDSLRKLTDKYCNELKEERLAAYRAELEAQQEQFLRGKIEKLEFIRKEQISCDIPITIEQKDIDETKMQLKQLLEEKKKSEIKNDN